MKIVYRALDSLKPYENNPRFNDEAVPAVMESIKEFGFKIPIVIDKNNIIKRNIVAYMAVNGESTLAELTKELHISVPTITKLVQELIEENIVNDLGKVETPGGRRPNVFGLANSAIYFAGVNVGRDNMTYVITDLQNNIRDITANINSCL